MLAASQTMSAGTASTAANQVLSEFLLAKHLVKQHRHDMR
jgi:hypothetical protein